uniref:Uncharacterized protein n=1 Tax=Anguilla anguilla TaxID=7936 RepID=A0A0E9WI24_ANGAN
MQTCSKKCLTLVRSGPSRNINRLSSRLGQIRFT